MAIQHTRHLAAPVARVWSVVSDVTAHAQLVPFTRVLTEPGKRPGVGWRFIARTQVAGRVVDDAMRLSIWSPPRTDDDGAEFRAEKVGRVLAGWAHVHVQPGAVPGTSTVVWAEHIRLQPRLPRSLERASGWLLDRASAVLFGLVLDRLLADNGIPRFAAPAHAPRE